MSNNRHYAFIPETTLLSHEFKKLKKNTRLLYVYIVAKRAGFDEWFSYSYREMRADSGYRFETIADSIRELKDAGFLEYQHGGLELNHNSYRLESVWLEL